QGSPIGPPLNPGRCPGLWLGGAVGAATGSGTLNLERLLCVPPFTLRPLRSCLSLRLPQLHLLAEGAVHLALVLALGDGVAFVGLAAAFAEADLELGDAVLEVHDQRHDRDALLLALLGETGDLALVGE